MSSAYACDCKKVVEDKRSFMNIKKSVGDRIDPWRTPKFIFLRSEVELPTLTFCCRSIRREFSNVRKESVIPAWFNFFISIPCGVGQHQEPF